METAPTSYQPGVCNIGPAEIRRRRQAGWVGLISAIGLAMLLVAMGVPSIARLLVAIPAAAAISGFLQAHLHFCAGFGMAGLQNLGALGQQQRVEAAAARSTDRRKAVKVHAAAIIGGIAVGTGVMLLPL